MAATDRRLAHDHQAAVERAAYELTAALASMQKADPDAKVVARALGLIASLSWSGSKIKADAYKAARWLEDVDAGAVLPSAPSASTAQSGPAVRTAAGWADFYAGLDQERVGACASRASATATAEENWSEAYEKVGLTAKSTRAASGGWERAISRVNAMAAERC